MDWIRERLLEVGVEPSSILVGGFRRVISIILILIAMKVLMGIGNRVIQGFFERRGRKILHRGEKGKHPFNHPKKCPWLYHIFYWVLDHCQPIRRCHFLDRSRRSRLPCHWFWCTKPGQGCGHRILYLF